MIAPLLILITVATCSQYIPLTNVSRPFIQEGTSNPTLILTVIGDPICIFCMLQAMETYQFITNLRSAIQSLTIQERSKIQINTEILPLPYHFFSHKIAQGIAYVNDKKGFSDAFECFYSFLKNIKKFQDAAIKNLTTKKVLEAIVNQILSVSKVNETQLANSLNHGTAQDTRVRIMAKKALGIRHASGTPTFYLNDAPVDSAYNYSVDQLVSLIRRFI